MKRGSLVHHRSRAPVGVNVRLHMQESRPFIPAGWPRSVAVFVFAVLSGIACVGIIFLGEEYGAAPISRFGFVLAAMSFVVGAAAWIHVMWHLILRGFLRKSKPGPLAEGHEVKRQ